MDYIWRNYYLKTGCVDCSFFYFIFELTECDDDWCRFSFSLLMIHFRLRNWKTNFLLNLFPQAFGPNAIEVRTLVTRQPSRNRLHRQYQFGHRNLHHNRRALNGDLNQFNLSHRHQRGGKSQTEPWHHRLGHHLTTTSNRIKRRSSRAAAGTQFPRLNSNSPRKL